MSKSVLTTITEYAKDPDARERLATSDLEIELCDRMVDLRERAGLTQQQLAEKMGFTQSYIAKLENGAYDRCGIGTLRTFARALGHDINIDHFFAPPTAMSRTHLIASYCGEADKALRAFVNAAIDKKPGDLNAPLETSTAPSRLVA